MTNFSQTDVEVVMQLATRPYIYPDLLADVTRLRDKLDALLDDMEAEAEDYDVDVADLEGYDFDALDLGDLDDDTDDW